MRKVILLSLLVLTNACFVYAQNTMTEHTSTKPKIPPKESNGPRPSGMYNIPRSFVGVSYNETKFNVEGAFLPQDMNPSRFKQQFALGVKAGHTYDINQYEPIAGGLFLGFRITWADLDFAEYKTLKAPSLTTIGEENMAYMNEYSYVPWNDELMTLDYTLSAGPAISIHPITHSGYYNLRLQAYFQVGYGVLGMQVKKGAQSGVESENNYAWGYGMSTNYGANLSWDHIGVGFEIFTGSKKKFKSFKDDFDMDSYKFKPKMSRLYLQINF